ncbi:MAG: hypothetical protein Q9213_006675 [Squamulea squamosa]
MLSISIDSGLFNKIHFSIELLYQTLPPLSRGEPYNRAINAFQIFSTDLTRWQERQGKLNGKGLKAYKIPSSEIPSFMRPMTGVQSASTMGSGLVQSPPPNKMLEEIIFPLYWDDEEARKEALEREFQKIPMDSIPGPDPRSYSGKEWRDGVRLLYDFERLSINFLSIVFVYLDRYDHSRQSLDLLDGNWEEVRDVLTGLTQTQITKIKFKTRPWKESEMLREWASVPSNLRTYMTIPAEGCIEPTSVASRTRGAQTPAPNEDPNVKLSSVQIYILTFISTVSSC